MKERAAKKAAKELREAAERESRLKKWHSNIESRLLLELGIHQKNDLKAFIAQKLIFQPLETELLRKEVSAKLAVEARVLIAYSGRMCRILKELFAL